jgi:hypothetical protein
MSARHQILIRLSFGVFFIAISSCTYLDTNRKTTGNNSSSSSEELQSAQTFLENYHNLKKTSSYRQNIWINWEHGVDSSQVALCVDLENQVYLIIRDSPTAGSEEKLTDFYRNLSLSVPTLRSRMDPDAFILSNRNSPDVVILRVPANPPESFAADAINQLLDRRLTPNRLTFQAD